MTKQYVKVEGLPTLTVDESPVGLVTVSDGDTTLVAAATSPLVEGEDLVLYQPLGDHITVGRIVEVGA